jgi:hypothetical protein
MTETTPPPKKAPPGLGPPSPKILAGSSLQLVSGLTDVVTSQQALPNLQGDSCEPNLSLA